MTNRNCGHRRATCICALLSFWKSIGKTEENNCLCTYESLEPSWVLASLRDTMFFARYLLASSRIMKAWPCFRFVNCLVNWLVNWLNTKKDVSFSLHFLSCSQICNFGPRAWRLLTFISWRKLEAGPIISVIMIKGYLSKRFQGAIPATTSCRKVQDAFHGSLSGSLSTIFWKHTPSGIWGALAHLHQGGLYRWAARGSGLKSQVDNTHFMVFTTVLTFYALTADDLRISPAKMEGWTSKP